MKGLNKLMNNFNIRLFTLITILASYAVTYGEQTDTVCADNLTQGLIQLGENSDDPELKRRSLELKESCVQQQRAKAKMEESRENLEIWKEVDKVLAGLPNRDMYQEVLDRSVKELRMHPYDVVKMMEKGDPKIKSIFNKMIKERNQKIFNEIKAKRIAQRKLRDKNSNKSSNKSGAANEK
jgi:hypothetical protein